MRCSAPSGAGRLPLDDAGHDFAQRRGVILGLVVALGPFDPEAREILAQARERALVQESGEVEGPVGQQFAASKPDEQIEVFALDPLHRGLRRGFGQFDMRDAERRRIAAQRRELLQQRRIGRAHQQAWRAARIPARARCRSRRPSAQLHRALDKDRAATPCDRRRSRLRRRARARREPCPSWKRMAAKCQRAARVWKHRRPPGWPRSVLDHASIAVKAHVAPAT